jgi:pSer/pThr/pTyr-binding forkhead associated (FHA) protein
MSSVDQSQNFGVIRFVTGSQQDSLVQLSKPITTIGRDPGNDIVVPDPSIALHHVRIRRDNGSYHIERVTSDATLRVNGQNVEKAPL